MSDDNAQRSLASDPFLADLVRGLPVCFAGIPHAKETERQQNFFHSAQMTKRLHIAIPSNGLNLHLSLSSAHLVPEQNEIRFFSDFLFNGSLVRLRGHINLRTLQGRVQVDLLQPRMATNLQNERIERRMAQFRATALRL